MDAGTHGRFRLRTGAVVLVGLTMAALGGASLIAEHDGGAAVVSPIAIADGHAASIAASARQTGLTSARPATPFRPLAGDEATAVAEWQRIVDEAVAVAMASGQGFAVAGQSSAGANTSAALAAAAAARSEAAGRSAGAPTPSTAAAPNSNPSLAAAAAVIQANASAQVCVALLAQRARVIIQFNEMIVRFPNRAAQLTLQRDRALADIDVQLGRFACTVPSSGGNARSPLRRGDGPGTGDVGVEDLLGGRPVAGPAPVRG